MTQLHVGKLIRNNRRMCLPEDAVTQTFSIIAKRGAGKTYAAMVLAEEMIGLGHQVVIIDPLDVWWGLRASADGKKVGLEVVIFGGSHSDLPLEPGSGELIADAIVEHGMSAIISLRHLRKNEQKRWVTAFAERLYHRKGQPQYSGPLHLFIDEADAFAPQKPFQGDQRMLGAVDDLVRRGRSAGIGVTLITQRSAAINKNVLTQTECMIALRTISPQDRKAIEEWIKAHDVQERREEFMRSLASLKLGEAWFWSPGWLDLFERVQVRQKRTFDSSATPKPGRRLQAPKKLAKPDLAKLREQLSETLEKAKADDPRELRKQIVELQRQLKANPGKKDGAAAAQATQRVVERAVVSAVGECDTHWRGQVAKLTATHKKATSRLAKIHDLSNVNGDLAVAIEEPPRPKNVARSPDTRPATVTQVHSRVPPDVNLSKAELAILKAAFWLRDEESTKPKLSFYSGYSSRSSSFSNVLSSLRTRGYLERFCITPEGQSIIAEIAGAKPSGAQLREWLRPKIGAAANALLDALMEAHPDRLNKDELSERSGYSATSSSFSNALSLLRTLEAANGTFLRDGGMKATDVFFEVVT